MKDGFQIIVDYVEGKLSVEDFRRYFLTNAELSKVLQKKMPKHYLYLKQYDYCLYNLFRYEYSFAKCNWNSISMKASLQGELQRFLDYYGVDYNPYTNYHENYMFVLDIQPSWLDIEDDSIFQQILDEIPQELSKTQRIKLGKERVKELFKYDKTYPRWIQSPEWPIVNGKPLVFSHQEKVKGDDFHTYYYFYDEDTKEQTVVEQFS